MASWLSAVGLHPLSEGSILGIFTWQHSFAGEDTRPEAHVVTFQSIAALSIGGGYYVRSSVIWSLDIPNNRNSIPLGAGFGKVFTIGDANETLLLSRNSRSITMGLASHRSNFSPVCFSSFERRRVETRRSASR